MEILLINPPNIEEDPVDAQVIPLGLLYIKEFIKKRGCSVNILNLYFEKSWESIEKILKGRNFNIVGIPCYTRQRFSTFKLAKICKETNKNAKVVLGGPHATFLDKLILDKFDFIDYIVRFEGEYTFLELVKYLENHDHYHIQNIPGITFRNQYGEPKRNTDRKLIKDLDRLPYPKFTVSELSCFPKCKSLKFHFSGVADIQNEYIAPVLSSRGCNHNCIFCCNGAYWNTQRYHSPAYVFKQIIGFYNKFGIRTFDFYDDNFTSSKKHVIELCDLIVENNLDIHWWCSSRAQDIDSTMLKKTRDAGCFMVSYGLESGSQKMLNNIRKDIKLDEVIKTCLLTKEAGLFLRCTIMIGNPGESIETIRKTIKVLHKLQPAQLGLFLMKIYPGTPLYQRGVREKIINNEYWFDKKNPSVLFHASENSLERLLEYRDMIVESIKKNIVSIYENKTYNLDIALEW